jgi:hypothetical protein
MLVSFYWAYGVNVALQQRPREKEDLKMYPRIISS